jgi:hypothetical protein
MSRRSVEIVDVTFDPDRERFLYGCLVSKHPRKYQRRREYLDTAIPNGFHKKILIFGGDIVGTIEYAPPEAAGYPIQGKDIMVVNCIWVLRRAKGHHLGTRLIEDMMQAEPSASGFATIGLEDHRSPWFKKSQIEKLGFRSINSVRVTHKTKQLGVPFAIHLMWLPLREGAEPPTWDKKKLLEGEYFCRAHPFYHPQTYKPKEILEEVLS